MIIKMIEEFNPNGEQRNVFGDGKASKNIVDTIKNIK